MPNFKDTISFKIWIDPATTIGLNKIRVKLDSYSEVLELNEGNNETTTDLEFQMMEVLLLCFSISICNCSYRHNNN
ncbi:MAG: hypothetical protein IPH89_02385 [Bacteroidetes bacterium]|nr:hypothetical protein [Bacteroidota bacterium]